MPRKVIFMCRFRWKMEPWKEAQNVRAIWLYCQNGILSFEMEIDPKVELPKNKGRPARASKHKVENNFIRVRDPKIISTIGKKVKDLTILGAKGKGVWLGDIELLLENETKQTPLMSTLEDWEEWLNYLQRGLPSL